MNAAARRASAMLLPLWLCAGGTAGIAAAEAPPASVELKVPRAPAPGEETWLRVRAGTLPRGTQLRISTGDGAPLGVVSAFGAKAAQAGGAYTVPLPKGAVVGGRLAVRVEVAGPEGKVRAPAASEVQGLELINVPVSR